MTQAASCGAGGRERGARQAQGSTRPCHSPTDQHRLCAGCAAARPTPRHCRPAQTAPTQHPPASHAPHAARRRWALAELNVTLAAFTHTFAEQRLLESHSFTRCPKREAFDKLCFGRGCADAAALQQHPQLQAAGLLLDTALAGCAEAAISQVGARVLGRLRVGAGWVQGRARVAA